jgi:hypothetical protein
MRNDTSRAPALIKRWLAKLKARNERAREISHKVGSARRDHSEHHAGHGGDGPGIGGGF